MTAADKLRRIKQRLEGTPCLCADLCELHYVCPRCEDLAEFPDPDAVGELENTNAELRGLLAECLALTPIVSGDMEKVRVWNDVVLRMKAAALAKLEEKPDA